MFTFKVRPGRLTTSDVREALGMEAGGPVAFISPHDDDALLGAGLVLPACQQAGLAAHLIIVTDGRFGYQRPEHRGDTIIKVRQAETFKAYAQVGIPAEQIHWLGYPDAGLMDFCGRWEAEPDAPMQIAGCTGLLNSLVHVIRKIRPLSVFLPTGRDPHPDHKITWHQSYWSLFMARSDYWPELGAPLGYEPRKFEYVVYSAFAEEPNLMVESREAAEIRLAAVEAYESQGDIGGLKQQLRGKGPAEYYRYFDWLTADPRAYEKLFAW